jgi:MSHA biogenesis protein MshJ
MNLKLKIWWGVQSTRINALSLRERVFLFLSVIACCLALADVLWMSPAQLAHKQLKQRFEKQSIDLQRARDELKTIAKPENKGSSVSDETATIKTRLDEVNQSIKNVVPLAADATPLTQVLVHFLSRHEGLTLVRTVVSAPDLPGAKAAAPTSLGASLPTALLTRQGVELTVSGPYPELVNYVQTLEKALPNVRWGSMKLKSEKLPPELTLQLFLVGVPS